MLIRSACLLLLISLLPAPALAGSPGVTDQRLVLELVAKEPDIVTPTGLTVDEVALRFEKFPIRRGTPDGNETSTVAGKEESIAMFRTRGPNGPDRGPNQWTIVDWKEVKALKEDGSEDKNDDGTVKKKIEYFLRPLACLLIVAQQDQRLNRTAQCDAHLGVEFQLLEEV